MATDYLFNPSCVKCGKPMGEMSEDEFIALVLVDGDAGECFDCAPVEADVPWWYLGSLSVGDRLYLSGYDSILITSDLAMSVDGAIAHARTRARSLSSSTYLNSSQEFVLLPKWILSNEILRDSRKRVQNAKGVGNVQ